MGSFSPNPPPYAPPLPEQVELQYDNAGNPYFRDMHGVWQPYANVPHVSDVGDNAIHKLLMLIVRWTRTLLMFKAPTTLVVDQMYLSPPLSR
jgi:hypothetical protein